MARDLKFGIELEVATGKSRGEVLEALQEAGINAVADGYGSSVSNAWKVQPDGSIKELPEPNRANNFSKDLRLTLAGKAKITDQGPVLGNSKVKIGMPIELDGFNYNFNATVIDLRLLEK